MKALYLLTAITLTGAALAQAPTTNTTAGSAISAGDKKFVAEASKAGLAEVEAAKIALQKTSNAEVKRFAQKMLDDHSKANTELTSVANRVGVASQSAPDAAFNTTAEKLRNLQGKNFEAAYVNLQLGDHQKAVKLFREEASGNANNNELKSFAQKTLPVLEQHLQHVQSLKVN